MCDITNSIRKFKEKLSGDGVLGVFSKTSDPAFIEAMGYSGLDFVILDIEHGPNSIQTTQNLIRGAQVADILPIVRVKEGCFSVMGEALDIGAGGIQVPQITSKAEAEEVIRRIKFSPQGERGVCRFVRAAEYSAKDRHQYFKEANETLFIAQLEGTEAIKNLEEILSVAGIDIIFIGPYDLSQSLGVPGEVNHPVVIEKMEQIVKQCKKKNIAVGVFTDSVENARRWKNRGVQYIAYSVDVGIFYDAIGSIVSNINP